MYVNKQIRVIFYMDTHTHGCRGGGVAFEAPGFSTK